MTAERCEGWTGEVGDDDADMARAPFRSANRQRVARKGAWSVKGALSQPWRGPLTCKNLLERMTGIEPAFSAWEADVLPLNYIRVTPRLGLRQPNTVGREDHHWVADTLWACC